MIIHTTVFERLLALSRETGTIGFLMYVADAFGYLGYVLVMLGRSFATPLFGGEPSNALTLFTTVAWVAMLLSLIGLATSWWTRPRAATSEQ